MEQTNDNKDRLGEEFTLESILAEFSDDPPAVPEDSGLYGPVTPEDATALSGPGGEEIIMAAQANEPEPQAPAETATESPEYDDGDMKIFIYRGEVTGEDAEGFSDYDIDSADYASGDIDYDSAAEDMGLDERFIAPDAEKSSEDSGAQLKRAAASPIIAFLALIAMKIKQSELSIHAEPPEEAEDLGEEMPPEKAARFYENRMPGLHMRALIALVISAVLLYISYGLPVAGAMKHESVCSAVCLILLLTVMLLGLDIMRAGLISLVKLRPQANSLVALSCIISAADAFIISLGVSAGGLPYCGVAALTMALSLYGSLLNCRSNRIAFRTASVKKTPYTLTAESGVSDDGVTLLKSMRGPKDFVRRTEEAGPDETVYALMTPGLILASVVLALLGALTGKNFAGFAHILSGVFVCAAPLSVLFIYPAQFFISSKLLVHSGAAIAGWSGLYDIGKSRSIIIGDRDLFAKKDVAIEKVRILSGMQPDKVISFAGSIIAASGSSMTSAFSDMMVKGGGTLQRVDEFSCHESGGLIALINGEEALCGSSGFMQLMGIRLPQKLALKNCVFLAVSGVLCGIFEMRYTASASVRASLVSLMHSYRHPIFAVRDFNITPQMLSMKFDMPTDGFDFPSYTERYEISAAEPSADSKPAAIISREGLTALLNLTDHGRRLFVIVRVSLLLSVLCTVIGMVLMAFWALGSGGIITYMLVWLAVQLLLMLFMRLR